MKFSPIIFDLNALKQFLPEFGTAWNNCVMKIAFFILGHDIDLGESKLPKAAYLLVNVGEIKRKMSKFESIYLFRVIFLKAVAQSKPLELEQNDCIIGFKVTAI